MCSGLSVKVMLRIGGLRGASQRLFGKKTTLTLSKLFLGDYSTKVLSLYWYTDLHSDNSSSTFTKVCPYRHPR